MIENEYKSKVSVIKIKMLRWMCIKTSQYKIRNYNIRILESVGVTSIRLWKINLTDLTYRENIYRLCNTENRQDWEEKNNQRKKKKT